MLVNRVGSFPRNCGFFDSLPKSRLEDHACASTFSEASNSLIFCNTRLNEAPLRQERMERSGGGARIRRRGAPTGSEERLSFFLWFTSWNWTSISGGFPGALPFIYCYCESQFLVIVHVGFGYRGTRKMIVGTSKRFATRKKGFNPVPSVPGATLFTGSLEVCPSGFGTSGHNYPIGSVWVLTIAATYLILGRSVPLSIKLEIS